MREKAFRKLSLQQRFQRLKQDGIYVASRVSTGYNVHLFTLDGFYVEMWRPLGLGYIRWIEVQKNEKVLEEYLDHLPGILEW